MRRFCVRHTALLSSRIRGRGVSDVAAAAKLGATGEPREGEFCPFCVRDIPDAVVREMGDTLGDTIVRRGSQQVAVRPK
jgi:hypothetical protein